MSGSKNNLPGIYHEDHLGQQKQKIKFHRSHIALNGQNNSIEVIYRYIHKLDTRIRSNRIF